MHSTLARLTWATALAVVIHTPVCGKAADPMEWKNRHLAVAVNAKAGTATLSNSLSKQALPVSLRSPKLDFDKTVSDGGVAPVSVERRDTADGPRWVGTFAPYDIGAAKAHLSVWLQAYEDKAYVRKGYELKLEGPAGKLPFREIVLDRVDLEGMSPSFKSRGDQSAPVLCESFFMGVEFPISVTKLEDQRYAVLASRPGIYLKPGQVFKSRDVVYGATPPGQVAKAFRAYVQEFRAQPADIFFGYNNWWTTPIHQNNEMMLALASKVKENLYDKYGVSLDVFTLDLGWSGLESIWDIDKKKFPNGFADLKELVNSMGTEMGFWVSPCSAYPEGLDNVWAEKAGYEVFEVGGRCTYFPCMGGRKYAEEFTKNAVRITKDYNVKHIKFDAYSYRCPSGEHGHLPGDYSVEPIAQRMVDLFEAVRKVQPDIRLNPLTVGPTGSPWWLKYVNFMAGSQGDDYPYGRGAAPIFRDSYTTAREYYTLRSALDPLIPMDCKEVFGIINQTKEPLFNDAVDVLMRGHQYVTLYLHPGRTTDEGWEFVSRIVKYGRANKDILRNTTILFPESWRQPDGTYKAGPKAMRDPYGYVHNDGKRALVYVRNPWMAEQTISVPLDEEHGFEKSDFNWSAVSVYPFVRVYGEGLKHGDVLSVKLRPYQNVLLELSPNAAKAAPVDYPSRIMVSGVESTLTRGVIPDDKAEYGPDWTRYTPAPGSPLAAAVLKCTVDTAHEQSKVMVLVETPEAQVFNPTAFAKVSGNTVEVKAIYSKDGWAADSGSPREHWTWFEIPVPAGKSSVEVEIADISPDAELSAWAYGETPVADPGRSPLLHPEPKDMESRQILEPTSMLEKSSAPAAEPKTEKIDGTYLDSIDPVSSRQGWGELARNRSVSGKRIRIGREYFRRGLGMHADAEVVYDLAGKWSRFTAMAGPNAFDRGTVTMSVVVDDKVVWESGFMKYGDEPKKIEVDLKRGKTLKLLVGDGGNGHGSDVADWGDAILWP